MKATLATLMIALGALSYTLYDGLNPCRSPLAYSIGEFDSQFGVTKADFEKKIEAGGNLWEKTLGKNFFEYKPDAKFKINLIYDSRQKQVDSKRKTEFGLSQAEDAFKALDADFKSVKAEYELRSSAYESKKADFLARSKQYESEVAAANARGGAKPAEYERLKVMQTELNAAAAALNAEAKSLNQSLAELNALLEKRNQAALSYNKVADSYNQKYGSGLEFDQAEYTGKEINVYEFGNSTDLTVALAHELGHALGMDHVENSKSIMYYRTGEQSLAPTPEDIAEIKRACRL